MSTPKQILENLIVAYRKLGGLDVAHDTELKNAEWLLANIGELENQRVNQLSHVMEERNTAIKAYRELLLKYDKLESRSQK